MYNSLLLKPGNPVASPHGLIKAFVVIYFCSITLVSCLHEDQKGKFDWRKQFIGVPKFVYHHKGSESTIVGTESNVVASILIKDGTVVWRKIMPKDCHLDHMSVFRSNDDDREYLIRTSCSSDTGNHFQFWTPHNGLLASQAHYKDIVEDDKAESIIADKGHTVDNIVAFTLTEHSSLTVNQDGQLSYVSRGKTIWSREESMAEITAAEIIQLPATIRDRFGLKKIIVLVTDAGKLFGLDTLTGDIVWQSFHKDISTRGQKSKALLLVGKQSDEEISESRAYVIHSKGIILDINPLNGDLHHIHNIGSGLKQIAQTPLNLADDQVRALLLYDVNNAVHIYPESARGEVIANLGKYFMTIVDDKSLQGFSFQLVADSIKSKLVWSFPINESEKILALKFKRLEEEVHSPARVLGDRGLLYKYVNPNLISIMTQGMTGPQCAQEFYINVYLVDGVTGALVHFVHHPKSRGPSSMVHAENWLVYSYYNTKARRNEMSSLEMFEGFTQANSSIFSSLARSSIKPKLIEHKSFIFPAGIDTMTETTTLRGMTNRHLIVALPTGALLEIPKIFLDPRRPINMLMEHREEGLIPYMPELPIPSESMINYDQSLIGVRKIIASPAMLESTSLVFAYGLDIFFTRVTPSKTFDVLKDDFDHLLITGALVFLVVASYVCKLLAQRKALHAAWK